jgi:hypothetical protein
MGWTAAVILRPITFVLAIVAAVITGNRSDSFWYGLLAFFVAMGVGRVIGALVRGRSDRALYKAIWPAAATGFAFLFAALGLPPAANFFVSIISASLTKSAFPSPTRVWRVRQINLDDILP